MLVTNLSNSLLVLILSIASPSRNVVQAQQQQQSSSYDKSSNNDPVPCGDTGLICLHGGSCVETKTLDPDTGIPFLDYLCDCSLAYGEKYRFVGETCEHKIELTNDPLPCGDAEHTCLHGGSCVESEVLDSDGTPYLDISCDCSLAYGDKYRFVGETCEIKKLREESDPISCGDAELTCLHGGSCVETELLDSDTGLPFLDFSCDCSLAYGDKYRFVGETCEVKKLREVYDPISCGDAELTCLHGGSCVETELLDSDTGLPFFDFSCDCSLAYGDKYRFVGETCEIKKLREDSYDPIQCGDTEHMCLHGGRCVETKLFDSDDNSDYSCDCSLAYGDKYQMVGEKCEIKKLRDNFNGVGNTNVADNECVQKCFNGGTCTKGVRDIEFLRVLHLPTKTKEFLFEEFTSSDNWYLDANQKGHLSYCECPKGWIGNTCEYPADVCEDNHVCLHGSKCGDGNLIDGYSCDCEESDLNCVLKMKGLKIVRDESDSTSIGMIIGIVFAVLVMIGLGIWKFNKNSITFPPCSKNDDVMNHQDRDEEVDIDFENVIIESDNNQIPSNKEFV